MFEYKYFIFMLLLCDNNTLFNMAGKKMQNKKFVIEAILFITYMLFAMSWVGAASFMSNIMQMANMHSLTEASFLSTALTMAKIVGTAIAAWAISKLGIRIAFTLASFLICFSIITPYAHNFTLLLISRFLMGLGGALIIVYFNPIIFKYFTASERPIINGLNAICFNVGTAIMMFGVPTFLKIFSSWQQVLTAISASSAVMLILWIIFGNIDLKNNSKQITENYSFKDGLKDKFNWAFAFTYSGLLSFYIVLFTFYPKAGIAQTKQVILFGIIGAVAGMIYSNKVKNRISIIRFSGLIQLVAAFALSFSNNMAISYASAAALGFFMFLPMSALITLAQEQPGMTAQKISVTFSLFWSISYLIATIIPTIFAKIVDLNHGSYTFAFIFICLVLSTFFLGSFLLKEPKVQG